jgi:hypothetical protein
MPKWISVVALGCLVTGSALAQYVVSAKSGMVHYTEGQVFLGEAIDPKPGEYPEIKEGQHLTTKQGRAEVLLTPGVFLRMSEDSDIAMLSTRLTDTRVEVASGSIVLEVGEVMKGNSVQLLVGGTTVEVTKSCLIRVDAGSPASIRVYDGEVNIVNGAETIRLKEGKQALLSTVPTIEKFAKNDSDAFLRWVSRRSGYMAMANMAAANQMRDRGVQWSSSDWYYSTLFGMYTYIPMNGRYRNYWNYAYYSPRTVMPPQTMGPPAMSNSDGFGAMNSSVRGMSDMSGRSYGGTSSSASPVYQAPASSAPAPAPVSAGEGRGADSGGSRGGSGGAR